MRIQEVEVERCGVWRQWKLPLSEGGIHVFHGPNEAGKTTLRRFIRGVLYGFPAQSADPECVPLRPASGALRIAADGRTWRLHRATAADGTGDVSLFSGAAAEPVANRLESWFQGISEQIFEDVFAVGLRELQQLATLSDDEAARRIYGITLGPEGQRLLEVSRRAQADRMRLLDPHCGTGTLVDLLEERDRLQARLETLHSQREEYTSLALRREQAEREIVDLKKRQAGIQHELRGHKLLERAHGPWLRLQECQDRLAEIPDVRSFPEDGLEKLDKLDADMEVASRTRQGLRAELQQWRQQAQITVEPRLRQHAASLQGLVAQRGLLEDLTSQSETALSRVAECEQTLAAAREQIDSEWTDARLAAIDLTPAAYQRLTNQAESLRSARRRASALNRACQRLKSAIRRRRELLDVRLLELGGTTVPEALTVQRGQLDRLQQVVQLRQSVVEMERRQAAITEHRNRVAPREQLPRWVQTILVVFGIAGFVLGMMGLVTGVSVGALAGSVYGLLGITCFGLASGLKWQYEHSTRQNLDELDQEDRSTTERLRETRESIARLTAAPAIDQHNGSDDAVDALGVEWHTEVSAAQSETTGASQVVIEDPGFRTTAANTPSKREAIQQVQGHLAELQEMGLAERKLRRAGRELRQLRTKREIARREVVTAGENWTELLRQLKFPETLEASAALELWQSLFDVLEARRRQYAARSQADHLESLTGSFRHRIKEQGQQMEDFQSDYDRPLKILGGWEQQLAELARQRQRRREFRDRIIARRREIRQYLRQIAALRTQRNVLLVQGGAINREEFEQRAAWSVQCSQLEREESSLHAALDTIQADFTDIAMVEEDLQQFNAESNTRAIEALNHESADLSGDLEREFERLGSLKHEISRLEEDDQATELHFELAQVQTRLQAAIREWYAVETAAQSLDQIRRQFERTHQPEMLRTASRFLEKLTLGKYHSVWMPLGERIMQVDDEHGQTLPVERLSRGTREQLFLAVRLAVVQDLAGRGIQLPLILDDVFVNFDEQRTDAALDLLLEFAARGQQILFFTCHKSLAQQFASRGAQTVHLPSHAAESTSGQRLAG